LKTIVVDEFKIERLFELLKENNNLSPFKTAIFTDFENEDNIFTCFTLFLESVTEHMSEFHIEQWKNDKYEFSIPVYKVSKTWAKKMLETDLLFSEEAKPHLPPETFDITELYLRSLIITDMQQIEDLIEINDTGLTTSYSTNEETGAYDSFMSAGIALKNVEFDIFISDKLKVKGLKQEVIEDCESLGINLNVPTSTCSTIDLTDYSEELTNLMKANNNINTVDITNYEVLGKPIEFLNEEDLEKKQTNAKNTAGLSIKELYK
jgi:hypothetical protein